jgi:ribonuclease P protein component
MYKKVFEAGRVLRSAPLTLRFCFAEQECSRLGFIIRKKVGNAPMRNSIRRTLRCSFQTAVTALTEGTWIIFDVSEKASKCRRSELRSEADRLLASLSTVVNPVSNR